MIKFQAELTDVFFDLDHTLWDFEKNSMLTFEKIFAQLDLPVELSQFLATYNPVNHAYWKLYRENQITQQELRHNRLADTFSKINMKASTQMVDEISEQYINHLSTFPHLFEGVISLLENLQKRFRLHIITNGFDQIQHYKIKNSGLEPFFEKVVTSDTVGFKKPHPQIFKEALRQTQAKAEKSLMIGDSLEADILGALAQGMHAIHFNSHNEPHHDICPIVYSLDEVNAFF